MSYFSQPKNERDRKDVIGTVTELRHEPAAATATATQPSTLARGMIITGNIVCSDPVQIFGRVIGDIHASHLTICEGAQVEGKVVAQDAVVYGMLKGTIHGNTVKLRGAAVVEGEIYNRALTIEEDARFEGMSRRLDQPVESPSLDSSSTEPSAEIVPLSGAA